MSIQRNPFGITIVQGVFWCASVLLLMPSLAGDQVSLAPSASDGGSWYPAAVRSESGTVVQFDDRAIRIVSDGQTGPAEAMWRSDRVLWIEPTNVSPAQAKVIEQFNTKDYTGVLAGLPAVLKERPPVWRQQWLTMMGAWAAMESGRGKIALELVSQLDARPLPPMVVAWLPIDWTGGPKSPALIDAAAARLNDPSALTRLVAASWLLSSADRATATSTLRSLSGQDGQEAVAMLAGCVLWRVATPPEVAQNADAWLDELDRLPMVLQTGPMVTLAEKCQAAGLDEPARRLKRSLELTPIHPHPFAK